jgi:hypothetical protein
VIGTVIIGTLRRVLLLQEIERVRDEAITVLATYAQAQVPRCR